MNITIESCSGGFIVEADREYVDKTYIPMKHYPRKKVFVEVVNLLGYVDSLLKSTVKEIEK